MIVSLLENVAFKAKVGVKKNGEETTNVLATQKLNGVLWDDQSIGLKGHKSIYVYAGRNTGPYIVKERGTILSCLCRLSRYCEGNCSHEKHKEREEGRGEGGREKGGRR